MLSKNWLYKRCSDMSVLGILEKEMWNSPPAAAGAFSDSVERR